MDAERGRGTQRKRSTTIAAFLSFLWPGAGQWYRGRRRAALLYALGSGAISIGFGTLVLAPWPAIVAIGGIYGALVAADSAVYSTAVTELAPASRIGSAQALQAVAGIGAVYAANTVGAIVGSMERFIGILIEHHAGSFPSWLAPVQAVVMNITDAQADWGEAVRKTLANQGVRVAADLRNEKIGYKIREHTLQRVPYLLVVGDREKDNGAVAVRSRSGEDMGTMSVADFAALLQNEDVRAEHVAA
mgnify:CR=1 FL=1